MTREIIDTKDSVRCDVCDKDFLSSDTRTGGILFGSYAYCPACTEKHLPKIREYGEEHFIKATCPAGMSFRDWVLQLRDGDNRIIVTTMERKDE